MIRVWYHANCYDGFGSAFAAYQYFNSSIELKTLKVEYVPCSYNEKIPDYNIDDTIYIVDFSFPKEDLIRIKNECEKIVVLDHHRTAQENCEGLDFAIFDMNRSGAGMTWDYFFPNEKRPRLIDLIEDRDLWKFEREGSKLLHAYLCSQPFDFKVWDKIHNTLEHDPDSIWGKAEVLLDSKQREVEKIVEKAWVTEAFGHKVVAVNTTAHWSEVGAEMLNKFPEAKFAISFTVFENNTMYSLRGRGDFDVAEIAKTQGGGGHKSAAGFKIEGSAHQMRDLSFE